MQHERISARRRTLKGGKVILSKSTLIDCVIRDLSETGARLEFSGATSLPSEFKLQFATSGEERLVTLTWQRGLSAGVHFEAPRP